jgi:adenylate cyclase
MKSPEALMPKKVLVIDDETDLLEALDTWLESHGYDVSTAKDGEEGLARARELRPNLVILDISMPKMDGFEVLSLIRANAQTATTPVIMLTAKGRTENIFQAEKLKAVDFLIKPFEAEELLTAVKKNIR